MDNFHIMYESIVIFITPNTHSKQAVFKRTGPKVYDFIYKMPFFPWFFSLMRTGKKTDRRKRTGCAWPGSFALIMQMFIKRRRHGFPDIIYLPFVSFYNRKSIKQTPLWPKGINRKAVSTHRNHAVQWSAIAAWFPAIWRSLRFQCQSSGTSG